MSQKTNPISLRLQNSNKHFESCWYSDFFYDQVLSDEVELRIYIEGLLYQSGRSKTLLSIQSHYKRYCTFLFFLDQRAERHKREFSLKLSREPVEHVFLPRTKFLPTKDKVSISARDGLLFNQAQDLLCREGLLSQEERYTYFTERIAKEKRSAFTHKNVQEYVCTYAIKGPSLEVLALSGLDSTRFLKRGEVDTYNTIINPGLKHKSFGRGSGCHKESNDKLTRCDATLYPASGQKPSKRGALAQSCESKPRLGGSFYINSKSFLGFSMISFALARPTPYIQESPFKATALVSPTEQRCDGAEPQQASELHYKERISSRAKEAPNTALFKTRVVKESTGKIFSVQEEGGENLFRRLIVDQHSQSTQNRLSYWIAKGLEKQLRRTDLSPLSDHKSFLTDSGTLQSKLYKEIAERGSLAQSSSPLQLRTGVESLGLEGYEGLGTSTLVSALDKTKLKKKTTCLAQQEWRAKSLGLVRHTELFLNIYSGNFGYHTVYPVRGQSPFQGASFLLESVAYLLQRKISFRQIKDDIFRELDQYQLIKGARLSCAGRLGGRSKKAQKAKTQSAQWGETSLTVFSSRLAFASKGVNTTYGKVGVKLWLCYKS